MKKICLFFDRPYIDAHYCFREMVMQFLKRGWRVDLLMDYCATHPVPYFATEDVQIILTHHSRVDLIKILYRLCFTQKYDAIVATPQWALYWAVKAGLWTRRPVLCLSDEVYLTDPKYWDAYQKIMPNQPKWKKREAWAHRQCAMTVALSEKRYESAKNENRLPDDHPYTIVPNAPAGPAKKLNSTFYRETLNIPSDRCLLLHSGGLSWSLLAPLAEEARKWRAPFTVVLQGRFKDDQPDLSSDAVRVSPVILPSDMMRYATSSADIGLMLYNRENTDEAKNGNTAGKLGLYLSCGLPVICCNLEILKWVEKEKCGVWVKNVSDIPRAAEAIMQNYSEYSRQAMRIFDEQFEYSGHFSGFYEKLEKILKKNGSRR